MKQEAGPQDAKPAGTLISDIQPPGLGGTNVVVQTPVYGIFYSSLDRWRQETTPRHRKWVPSSPHGQVAASGPRSDQKPTFVPVPGTLPQNAQCLGGQVPDSNACTLSRKVAQMALEASGTGQNESPSRIQSDKSSPWAGQREARARGPAFTHSRRCVC